MVPGRRVFVKRWPQHVIAQGHISPEDVLLLTALPMIMCTGGSEYCAICGVAYPVALSAARDCKGRGRLGPAPCLGPARQTSRSVWNWRRR